MRSALVLLGSATLALSCVDSSPSLPAASATTGVDVAMGKSQTSGRPRTVRLGGTLEAVRSTRIAVPALTGPTSQMTLTRLVPNGATVAAADIVAEFDPLEQQDHARQSAASYEDLSFQVRQRHADNAANVEQRRSAREEAQAELEKARLDVSTASLVSEVEAEQNELRAAKARAQLESLDRKRADEELVDRAELRILELQRDRQRAAYERARANLERLQVRAPIAGMVVHAMRYSAGRMTRPQEGDQMSRNDSLLSIFDPGEMLVRVSVAEPDGALLRRAQPATVYIDAYPNLTVPARLESVSPVASAPLFGGGVKSFRAVFRLDEVDPRLMPDLSAAVVFEAGP